MKRPSRFAGIAALALLAGAGCGRQSDAETAEEDAAGRAPVAVPQATAEPREPDADTLALWEAQDTLRDRARQLQEARERAQAFEIELRRTQEKVSELAAALQSTQQAERRTRQELTRLQQRLATTSQALEVTDANREDTAGLLAEWVAYAKACEAQVQEYAEYIDLQDAELRRMAALLADSRQPVREEAAPRVPERLVPGTRHAVPRRKFASLVRGMTADELRNYIGPPDAVEGAGARQALEYRRSLTYAENEKVRDVGVTIIMDNGVATQCLFEEP
jgi:hypothetical protein